MILTDNSSSPSDYKNVILNTANVFNNIGALFVENLHKK